jgi:hypothetical protein
MKAHNLDLVQRGADPETIAACHLGLGIAMFLDCRHTKEELITLVTRTVAGYEVAPAS